jgi:hypothetical protein
MIREVKLYMPMDDIVCPNCGYMYSIIISSLLREGRSHEQRKCLRCHAVFEVTK